MEGILGPLTVRSRWHHPTGHPRVFEADRWAACITLHIENSADVRIGVQMLWVKTVFRINVSEQRIHFRLIVRRIPVMIPRVILRTLMKEFNQSLQLRIVK